MTSLTIKDMTVYFIEGNIGAGKSTLIERLKQTLETTNTKVNIKFLTEPIDTWTNYYGVNMLNEFYQNKNTNAFKFQWLAFMSVYKQIMESYGNYDILICERSPHTVRHIFIEMLREDGCLDEIEYKLLTDFIDTVLEHTNFPEHKFIFLDESTQTCLERIQQRGRIEEKDINIDYLKNLKKWHDKYLLDKSNVTVINLSS